MGIFVASALAAVFSAAAFVSFCLVKSKVFFISAVAVVQTTVTAFTTAFAFFCAKASTAARIFCAALSITQNIAYILAAIAVSKSFFTKKHVKEKRTAAMRTE